MKQASRIFLIVLLLAVASAQVWLVFNAYTTIIHGPAALMPKTSLQLFKAIIAGVKFKVYSLIFFTFLSVAIYGYNTLWNGLNILARHFILSTANFIREGINNKIFYLLIIPLFASIYYALSMPISYDEAWTYDHFTSEGLWNSISYYPVPNNHILYSALTNLFVLLPVDSLLAMRLPSIIANVLCLVFGYFFIKEYYGKYTAYIAIAVMGVFNMFLYYSYMSRGYCLECLFFILFTYSIFKIISNPQNKIYWSYYALSAILGFYTMPSFLYPFVIGNVYLVLQFKRIFKNHFTFNVLTSVITAALYYPIIDRNGIHSLVGNEFVKPISRSLVIKGLLPFFRITYIGITGWPIGLVLLISLIACVLLYKKYKGPTRYYFPFVLLISPLLLILHSVLPFARTFEYFAFIFAVFTGVVIAEVLKQDAMKKYIYLLLIPIQLAMVYRFNCNIYDDEKYAIVTAQGVKTMNGANKFYCNSMLFDKYITYYNKVKKNTDYKMKNVYFLKPHNLINLDTLSDKSYDYYIIDNTVNATSEKRPVAENEFYKIYKQ